MRGIGCKYLGGTKLLKYVVHRNKYKWDSKPKYQPEKDNKEPTLWPLVWALFGFIFIVSLLK